MTRAPHLLGTILTGGLIVGLIATLIWTFTVALSASTASESAAPSGPSSATRLVAAPEGDDAADPTPDDATDTGAAAPTEAVEETAPEVPDTGDLDLSAQSAFVMDVKTGKALAALNADERRPMASLTKMVTALVVTQALDNDLISLNESVVIDETDVVDPTIYSHMGLAAGDTVTIEQLLVGMMIPSGNDAAKALARHIGERLPEAEEMGARNAFVGAMNEVVADLGLEDTAFQSPDGDDDEGNYSTAHDLAYIGQAVMKSKLLAEIVATRHVVVTSTGFEQREYDLLNTNHLLGTAGVDGIKTGTTVGAGACLVVSSTLEDGRRVVVVVLGSDPDPLDGAGDPIDWPRFADARALFAQATAAS